MDGSEHGESEQLQSSENNSVNVEVRHLSTTACDCVLQLSFGQLTGV